MTILDVFQYAGERAMLDARLGELDGLVVPVAVMGNRTFQGDPVEYPDTPDGVARIEVDLARFDGRGRGGTGEVGFMERERFQRDASGEACVLLDARAGDVFMVSDVDEIPYRDALAVAVDALDRCPAPVLVLRHEMFVWGPAWRFPGPWLGSTLVRLAPNPFGGPGVPVLSGQQMRDARGTETCATIDTPGDWQGWHLSWWGGTEANQAKLAAFSHAELAGLSGRLGERARVGRDVNGTWLTPVVDWRTLAWPRGLEVESWGW